MIEWMVYFISCSWWCYGSPPHLDKRLVVSSWTPQNNAKRILTSIVLSVLQLFLFSSLYQNTFRNKVYPGVGCSTHAWNYDYRFKAYMSRHMYIHIEIQYWHYIDMCISNIYPFLFISILSIYSMWCPFIGWSKNNINSFTCKSTIGHSMAYREI